MFPFDPTYYGPVIAELLAERRLSPLGPGSPNLAERPKLQAFNVRSAFGSGPVHDWDMAAACLAGLWLYHDFLDESHALSQTLKSTTGAYWHGLMHRREPDFGNAKYWFARVGNHPVYRPLAADAAQLAAGDEPAEATRFLTTQQTWDPDAFIDLCEASLAGRAPAELLCRRIQQIEWEHLFDFCYRCALGL
jgi:hypothetical protein